MLRWQWIAVIPLLLVSVFPGGVASRLVRVIGAHVVSRTKTTWDDVILERLGGPLTAALTLVVAGLLLQYLSLDRTAADQAFRIIRVAFHGVFFAALWRVVNIARDLLAALPWARASSSSRALLPLAGRVLKVMLAAIGAVVLLSTLGFPVTSPWPGSVLVASRSPSPRRRRSRTSSARSRWAWTNRFARATS